MPRRAQSDSVRRFRIVCASCSVVVGALLAPTTAAGSLPDDSRPATAELETKPGVLADLLTGPTQGPARFPSRFRTTSVRGQAAGLPGSGNSLDGFERAAEEGVRAVEADFRLNADGVLVAAHDDEMSGNCGRVSRATSARLERCRLAHGYRTATLRQLLALPFDEIYLDLKDTLIGVDRFGTTDPSRAANAVRRAIADVRAAGRTSDVTITVYEAPDAVKVLGDEEGVRGGLKGYPHTAQETLRMNRIAALYGLELVCVEVVAVNAEVIEDAARMGVWHLPWAGDGVGVRRLRALAAEGLGGLITDQYDLIDDEVAPSWNSPARFHRPQR
jgi:hypothetical protein